jgi:hypothetical protein
MVLENNCGREGRLRDGFYLETLDSELFRPIWKGLQVENFRLINNCEIPKYPDPSCLRMIPGVILIYNFVKTCHNISLPLNPQGI